MKLNQELKRIEGELKISSLHDVELNSNAKAFELSLDELRYVAGGTVSKYIGDTEKN